jgi:hypothetical protein
MPKIGFLRLRGRFATSVAESCDFAIYEIKLSDRGRNRALLGLVVWKSSQSGAYSGPLFDPSHG